MRVLTCFGILLFILAACGGNPHREQAGHNSRNSLDWAGTYTGVLPCASCPGIDTTLVLQTDGQYRLRTLYRDKTDAQERTGKFAWNDAGNQVQLLGIDPNANPTLYLVQENRLVQLDMKGERVSGALANRYVLQKVVPVLAGPEWQLVEMQGKSVAASKHSGPHIQFLQEDKRVAGHSGCNRFFGSYQTSGTASAGFTPLSLSAIGATKMACLDGDLNTREQRFFDLLQQVTAYALEGEYLVLYKGEAALMRFAMP